MPMYSVLPQVPMKNSSPGHTPLPVLRIVAAYVSLAPLACAHMDLPMPAKQTFAHQASALDARAYSPSAYYPYNVAQTLTAMI